VLDYLDWSSLAAARESVRRYRLFTRVGTHTLVSRAKLNTLCTLVGQLEAEQVPGAIVECGVFKGGAAALMASEAGGRRDVLLFDSFEGLPPPGAKDGTIATGQYHAGWCASTEDDVRAIFARMGVMNDRVRLVKGWFENTFPVTPVPPVAMLHVDADWYDSVRLCLETHFDRLVPGGFLVLDDYGRWEGCTRATDEFLAARGLGPLTPTGSVGHYLRKSA
jgi:O-methyltransferase